MATYYGLTAASAVGTSFDNQHRPIVGLAHGRVRNTAGRVNGTLFASGDVLVLAPIRSSARLLALWAFGDGAAAEGAVDIGVHKRSSSGLGAVVDADFFATALTVPSSAALTECFAERAAANNKFRGQPLWTALGLSADPGLNYWITATVSTTFTTTAPDIGVFGLYTAQND